MADPTTDIETPAPAADAPPVETPTVDAGAAPPPAGEEQLTTDQKAAAAFDKGVTEQRAIDTGVPVEKVEAPPADGKKPPEKDAKADDGKPPAKDAPPSNEREAAIEKEITTLGLKEKTAERFRELSKRPSEQEIAPLREKADRFENWDKIITESTARPDQLSNALGYLQAINSGDPAKMGKAYDVMVQEVAWLGKQLGREVPGAYDPLTDHGDLRQKVEQGDITREAALEIARHRAVDARTTERTRALTETQQREAAHADQVETAMAGLGALTARLKSTDPHFAAKLEQLKPILGVISKTVPPAQWVGAAEEAYRAIQAPAAPPPAAAPPPVGHVPLRPTGGSGGQARKFNPAEIDRGDPFMVGVQNAR